MNVEDQLRAAGRAVRDQVRDLPELDLTRPGPAQPGTRKGGPRRWRAGWLIPLTAAAAVIVVAATLVSVRTLSSPARPAAGQSGPANSGATAGQDQVPAYYAAITKPTAAAPDDVTIAKTATGTVLFTVKPRPGTSFAHVTAAADDRTFAIPVSPFPGSSSAQATIAWDLLRVSPSATSYTLRRLPIPVPPGNSDLDGFALSPDGTRLAVMFNENTAGVGTRVIVRIYSVATGEALHTWQTGILLEFETASIDNVIRWLANGHELAFAWFAEQKTGPASATFLPEVRRVDLAKPGTDLITGSALVTESSGTKEACGDLQPTADGKGALCGMGPLFALGQGAATCVSLELPAGFYAYSGVPATSRLLYSVPVTRQVKGKCFTVNADVLWASPSGSVMAAMVSTALVTGSHTDLYTSVVGVISHGRWTPLPVSVLRPGHASKATEFAF